MRRVVGVLLIGLAVLTGSCGIYALAREDVQGGADAEGAILLVIAVFAVMLGTAVLGLGRRNT